MSQLTRGTPSQRLSAEVSIVVCDPVWVISVVVNGESVEQEKAMLVIAMESVIFSVVDERDTSSSLPLIISYN